MLRKIGVLGVAVVALGLAACGGTNSPTAKVASSNQRGTLVDNPPLRVASVNAADFSAQLSATASGPQLLQLAGTPACGVDFYYFKYWTVGPDNSAQEASGALMVPTGSAAPCTGPRPVVLYAHGTTTDSAYNIANISDTSNSANSEAATVAAVFAAQGYIVVAPNYLGYDISTLGYHPYINGAAERDRHDGCADGRPRSAAHHVHPEYQRQRQAVCHRVFGRRLRRDGDGQGDAGGRRSRHCVGAVCPDPMRWRRLAMRFSSAR